MSVLLDGDGTEQTILVTELGNHRVSEFALDGTFLRIFAGSTREADEVFGEVPGSEDDGEFDRPAGITVLASSGEVAIADLGNSCIQIFDRQGNFQRKFGSYGTEEDGQFRLVHSLASDAYGNILVVDLYTTRLQVFNSEGEHLCTRTDLRCDCDLGSKGLAWGAHGQLAVANTSDDKVRVWY